MDTQCGWIIVIFNADNTIEAVPDMWFKKKCMCLPKYRFVKK